ncbi:PREDICTED: uncharacterized protein LOC108572525 [Habropoda laboriosa]|uniref:uncharacterized protein LOC108572525 n=1 Tax=Habropoda laboriosa TaxID=597456 RepID=UPI00083DEDC6|nr:PREDICTED: uncharacterized protein LOC108572525 [Habropoda laboriosa]
MAPGSTTLTSLLLLLMAIARVSLTRNILERTESPFLKILRGVKLPGGYMEVIQEDYCSHGVVRLTCRSLKAFIFVLEAQYLSNTTSMCGYQSQKFMEKKMYKSRGSILTLKRKELKGNYIDDPDEQRFGAVDVRQSLNKRCSGQKHCRYNFTTDHPGAIYWNPATLRLKYSCIPESAVRKYCNEELKVVPGEGGFINSPGYPLYYLGENTCGWTFRSAPGHRILLTFHDLDIRGPEPDGSCVDIVRVRENGRTLLEYCGTAAGIKVVSNSNVITLNLVASKRLYTARGFFLQYQVLGCPDVSAPNGSYILNGTSLTSRTFLCKLGTVFPDSKEKTRILECKNGKWNESVISIPSCTATSAVILKTEHDHHRLSSLSGDNVLGSGVRIGRGEDAVAVGNGNVMDSAQSAMMKQTDYVVDIVLPAVLIALLFVGNAIIVYIIFQYRKRKVPSMEQGEEMALRNAAEVPQV